ncbi:hypothetical protein JCM9279_004020 [Rhodotorula babjevae]
MQASVAAVPWQEQADPFLAQLSLLTSWFLKILAKSRLRTPDWRAQRKVTILGILEQLTLHRQTWLGDELRGVLEHLLATYVGLLAPHALQFFDWYQLSYKAIGRKVGRFPPEGHPSRSTGANAREANEYALVRTAARRAGTAFFGSLERGGEFEDEFCSDAGVTILKMRRLHDDAREKLLGELAALPERVPERVRFLEEHGLPTTAANVLASPTATMLWAHDASQPPSARLARFKHLVDTLVLLYSHAVALERLPPSALPPLEARAHELARAHGPAEEAFEAKPLAVQVSAVDHARDVVCAACEAFAGEGTMRDGLAVAKDLAAAFHGAAPPASAAAHEPLVEQSLGTAHGRARARQARSRFFPEARRGAW